MKGADRRNTGSCLTEGLSSFFMGRKPVECAKGAKQGGKTRQNKAEKKVKNVVDMMGEDVL